MLFVLLCFTYMEAFISILTYFVWNHLIRYSSMSLFFPRRNPLVCRTMLSFRNEDIHFYIKFWIIYQVQIGTSSASNRFHLLLSALDPIWRVFRYPTVMFSTGPMFLTQEASKYPNRSSLNTLSTELYGKYASNSSQALFRHLKGSNINLSMIPSHVLFFSIKLAWKWCIIGQMDLSLAKYFSLEFPRCRSLHYSYCSTTL